MQRVFAVSGFSFSGKTFLLEQIISKLREEGFSVASVKSTKEDIIAQEGTDTWRHAQAGADPTLLIGPNTTTLRVKRSMEIAEFANIIDVDFILLEGFKNLDVPRFWCIGGNTSEDDFQPKNVKAYVLWDGAKRPDLGDGTPVISNSDISILVEIVKKEARNIYKE